MHEESSPIFTHPIRVSWGDCDPARIAYTARLPWFALEAIDAWWEHVSGGNGWFQMETDLNLGTPFVHMSMNFRSPVTPRHRLMCRVWPVKLGGTSIRFRVEALQDGQLCFDGEFVCVFVVADKFQKQSPPADIQNMIDPYLRDFDGHPKVSR